MEDVSCKCVAHPACYQLLWGEKHSLNVGYYHVDRIVSEMFYAGYDQLGSQVRNKLAHFLYAKSFAFGTHFFSIRVLHRNTEPLH